MEKHAYLIMVHNEWESLQYLLQVIDDERNDIFIHVDKKSKNVDFAEIRSWVKKSELIFVPRINVRWGHYSLVECELLLFRHATAKGTYRYYHLLSGVDFPLKTQDEIHERLRNEKREFIFAFKDGERGDSFLEKVQYYYPLCRVVGRGAFEGPGRRMKIMRRLGNWQWRFTQWQKKKGVNRLAHYPNVTFYKGNTWISVTDSFARYLLEKEKWIRKVFRLTNCADEIFIPTLAMNSEFRERVAEGDLRKIDWDRGNPYSFQLEDLQELKESDAFFARKISFVKDPLLVKGLMEHLHKWPEGEKKENPLVSVIVPIYNVEEFLPNCLQLLKEQTYPQIEVILVDDGTKDHSDEIAKDWAERDTRFRYIRQENGGLSAARNRGITLATGDYLAFVDSDDWVEPDYIEKMVRTAQATDADVTVCGYVKEDGTGDEVAFPEAKTFSRTEAMAILGNIFTEEYVVMNVAWNKLYKREIFATLRYAEGRIHEDEYAAHRVIDGASILSVIPDALYHYRIRQGSITGSDAKQDLRHLDILEGHLDRVACCRRQFYNDFYHLIVYSMFEELVLLVVNYSKETYRKHHLQGRFRKIILSWYITYFKVLDKHQKIEYFWMFLSPVNYRKRKQLEELRKAKK